MSKVLILSGSTGQGHNSCANAIKEYFEACGDSCEIIDAFSHVSKQFSSVISNGHTCIYRYAPTLFRGGYSFSDNHPELLKENSAVYRVLATGRSSLYKYICDGGFDLVISVHLFAAIMITDIIKNCALKVKTAFVTTDYTYYPATVDCICDKVFVAGQAMLDVYSGFGVDRDSLVVSGIPIRAEFFESKDKQHAKKEIGIKDNNKHLLIMSGSMGCGPIAKLLSMLDANSQGIEISVICGTNKSLLRQLERKYKDNPDIHIIGFTDEIPLYMDSADLYLTKPGGVSVTEAAAKRLPMVFIDAVAGCEQYNMDYFVTLGAAVTDSNIKILADKTIELLNDDKLRSQMVNALEDYNQPNGAQIIYNELC